MNYENNREEKRIISAYPVLTRYLIFLSTTSPIRLKNKNDKNVIRLQCILIYHCLDTHCPRCLLFLPKYIDFTPVSLSVKISMNVYGWIA